MLAESEQLRQLQAAAQGRRPRIRTVLEEIRAILQRGGSSRLIGIGGSRIMASLGACAFCKLSSGVLEGIQAWLVERLGEFVRFVPAAAVAKA
ncbi:NifU family protein [Bradyrhizobium elkanii]|uniref:NifU family protein n=1 Tax=Bradyrhizobium elkanii TaxID=29448 RepID=UPI001BA6A4DE|nr:NifU family protein [Bradyrhizobium elkanii]MBR1163249.1 NifU family protein [Bradyrhizobium elkanii]